MVDRYNAVNPFGNIGQEGPPPLPPETCQYGCPARFWAVNARRLNSWKGSKGTMEIVALTGSTLLLLWSFQAFILSFIPYLFHSETVALLACPSWSQESIYFQQASSQEISTVTPAPWYWIVNIRSYLITLSNASNQPLFYRCMWFEVCHDNNPHPIQTPQHNHNKNNKNIHL